MSWLMGLFEHHNEEPKRSVNWIGNRRRLGAGAVALVLAVSVAACGGSDSSSSTTGTAASTTATQATSKATSNGVADKSADEVLAAAKAAATGASAVHVSGTTDDTTIDLSLVRGKGASGSIQQGTSRFDLISVSDAIYLRGSDEFYRGLGGEAVVRLLAGKWLKVPATSRDFASFAQFADMETLLTEVLKPEGAIEKGAVETVDGAEVVPLTAGSRGTLYVAATGDPFPVKLGAGEGRTGQITFSRWNEPVDLTAPADAIDVDQLAQAGN